MNADDAVDSDGLGRLDLVPLRQVWPHEASDFTPWLLQHADVLGAELGMQLRMESAEHAVGDFSLDLIGIDEITGERVIVENQLEPTDHGHLGQLLTYAAGTDAANIVWVADTFRPEHRAALEWLNTRTDESTRLFGVEITAVRIGDSLPAPLFRVVVQPNDWEKGTRRRAASPAGYAVELGDRYERFWTQFIEAATPHDIGALRNRRAPRTNYLVIERPTPDTEISVSFGRGGPMSYLYLGSGDAQVNHTRFNKLKEQQDALESAYGGTLTWDFVDTRTACRIFDERPGRISKHIDWEYYIAWFIDSHKRLKNALAAIGGMPQ